MAIKSYTEQLEEVQAAISRILTGAEEYSIGDRAAREAKLESLWIAETRLRAEVVKEEARSDGKIGVRRIIPGFRG